MTLSLTYPLSLCSYLTHSLIVPSLVVVVAYIYFLRVLFWVLEVFSLPAFKTSYFFKHSSLSIPRFKQAYCVRGESKSSTGAFFDLSLTEGVLRVFLYLNCDDTMD